jgi:GT2 family glycosyltransferase
VEQTCCGKFITFAEYFPAKRSSPLMTEKVTAVILNWNGYKDTCRCVESLKDIEYNNLDIVVVDNGSTDSSGEKIETEYDSVQVIYNNKNLGFGSGINSGIRHAIEIGSQYVWILNNDSEVLESGTLQSLVNTISDNQDIGAVSPVIESPSGESWFTKGFINDKTGESGHKEVDPVPEKTIENEFVPACCVLFPVWVFEEVGMFDEDFFIYYDDVDHCIRLRDRGYSLLTDTSTRVMHKGSATSERTGGKIYPYYSARNRFILTRKHSFNTLSAIFDHFQWLIYYLAYYTYNKKYTKVFALLLGILDGILGRVGKGRYP